MLIQRTGASNGGLTYYKVVDMYKVTPRVIELLVKNISYREEI